MSLENGNWKIEGKGKKQIPHPAQMANGVRNDLFDFFRKY